MSNKLVGICEIQKHTGLSVMMILDLKKHYDLPVEKIGAELCASPKDLDRWLKMNGVDSGPKMDGVNHWLAFSLAKVHAFRAKKNRHDSDQEIAGDANLICEKLGISLGTFASVLGTTGCPIVNGPKGTNVYKVRTALWGDFCEDRDNAARERRLKEMTSSERAARGAPPPPRRW